MCQWMAHVINVQKGDIVNIIAKNDTGTWIGSCNGKIGHFKFISVEEITSGQSVNKSITNDTANGTNNNSGSNNNSNNASLIHSNCNDSSNGQTSILSLNCPSSKPVAIGTSCISSSSTSTSKTNVASINLNGATVIRVNPYVNNKTCVTLSCHGSPIVRQPSQSDQRLAPSAAAAAATTTTTTTATAGNTTRFEVSNEVTQFTKLKSLLPFLLSQPSESISLGTFFQLLPFGTASVNCYVFKFNSYGINNLQQLLNQVTGEKASQMTSNPNASLVSICIGNEGHRQLLYNALDFFGGIQQEQHHKQNNITSMDDQATPPPLPKKSLTMSDLSNQLDCRSHQSVSNSSCPPTEEQLMAPHQMSNKGNSEHPCCSSMNVGSSRFYCVDSEMVDTHDKKTGGQDVCLLSMPMDVESNEINCSSIVSSGHFTDQHNNQENNNAAGGGNRFLSIRNRKLNLPATGQVRYSSQTAKSAPSTPAGEVSSDDLTAWFRRFSFFGPG